MPTTTTRPLPGTARRSLLAALPEAGVGLVVNPGCDRGDLPGGPGPGGAAIPTSMPPWASTRRTAPAAGEADLEAIRALCRTMKRRWPSGRSAWTTTGRKIPPREFQQEVFRRQMASWRRSWTCPSSSTTGRPTGTAWPLCKEFPGVRGVFHCYSGSPEMAKELLKRGWYLGFDGPITYKNARRAPEVAAVHPLWTGSWWRQTPPTSPPCPSGASGTTAGTCPM